LPAGARCTTSKTGRALTLPPMTRSPAPQRQRSRDPEFQTVLPTAPAHGRAASCPWLVAGGTGGLRCRRNEPNNQWLHPPRRRAQPAPLLALGLTRTAFDLDHPRQQPQAVHHVVDQAHHARDLIDGQGERCRGPPVPGTVTTRRTDGLRDPPVTPQPQVPYSGEPRTPPRFQHHNLLPVAVLDEPRGGYLYGSRVRQAAVLTAMVQGPGGGRHTPARWSAPDYRHTSAGHRPTVA